eukprot:TRINITY_DN61237_c0_g1_i1.p1 TRINITY_DN61237_c0_g1~~TRINITY_DN61237_c0_g1_i1.p1  ORF type:complete len:122 (+),score=37.46 TRINITY_DN61237_c0_g1_i1:58-423(+)
MKCIVFFRFFFFFFQAEDGIRDAQESRGLGDVYKRQGALCGDVSLELGALGATFLESVKVATRTHLRRYKMQKADYTKLYKLILKRLDKAYKDRVAPVIRRSTEHIRLCEFIDEQYLLLGL